MMIFNFIILNGFTRSKNRIIKDYIRRSSLSLSLFFSFSLFPFSRHKWLAAPSLSSWTSDLWGRHNGWLSKQNVGFEIHRYFIHMDTTYHITTNSIVKKTSIHIIVTPTRRLYLLAHHFRQSIVFSRFCPFLSFSNRVKVPKSSRRL